MHFRKIRAIYGRELERKIGWKASHVVLDSIRKNGEVDPCQIVLVVTTFQLGHFTLCTHRHDDQEQEVNRHPFFLFVFTDWIVCDNCSDCKD